MNDLAAMQADNQIQHTKNYDLIFQSEIYDTDIFRNAVKSCMEKKFFKLN